MKNLRIIISIFAATLLLSACQKDVDYGGTTTIASNKWQFRYFPTFYVGNITRAYISNKTLYIKGKSADSTSNFQLRLSTTDSTFKIGDYNASLNESNFLYSKNGSTTFQSAVSSDDFIVRITLITDKIIMGDFLGNTKDATSNDLSLTQGKFEANFTSVGP